MHMHWTEYKIT